MLEFKSFYSAFDGLKILLWKERFDSLSRGEIPHPVCVHVDAVDPVTLQSIPDDDLLWLADGIKTLGASSIYFSADSEDFMHPASGRFINKMKEIDIETCLVTNGIHIEPFLDDILNSCKIVVVNVDAATPDTYLKFKKRKEMDFFKTITNIQKMVRLKKNGPEIVFKFLLHPVTYEEMYDAVVLAKSLKVDGVQIRPCYSKDVVWYNNIVREIAEAGRRAAELSNRNFYVNLTIPFADNEMNIKKCERCNITPLAGLTFSANGYVYICHDLKNREEGKLCRWNEIEQVYGSEKHKEILANFNTKTCPLQCRDAVYQEIYERIIKEDLLKYKFI